MSCISVVIPTYNRAGQLVRVLPTYLASPLVKEVIVVDDHGTDRASESLAELMASDRRLICLRNETNRGAPASRNRGALCARGDWVMQSEDDLALGTNCLEILLTHAKETGADIIAGRRIWMRLGETEEQALARANKNQQAPFNEWFMDHNSHAVGARDIETPLLNGTMLIRRELFGSIQYFEPYGGQSTWREESDFQLSALELGYKVVFCPHAVTFHYSRASQSFGSSRLKGTAIYAYRVYHNNLIFLRRHRDYLTAHYPRSLVLGSPALTAFMYGIFRGTWLLATEVMRAVRLRKYGGFGWK